MTKPKRPEDKLKVGRPLIIDETVVAKLEAAAAMDCSISEMCSYADISRDAYYDYIKRNPKFSDRISNLRNRPFLKARQTIIKGLDEPEFALKYMERKKKDEFSLKTENEVTFTNDYETIAKNLGLK